MLSILCRHAVDLEWIERNPLVDIEKLSGGEYKAWPDDKLAAFENYCAKHELTTAMTAFELGVGTGQRIGEFMAVAQEKTGAKIWVYCPTRLQDYLARLPRTGKYILAKNLTRPIGTRQVQKAVEVIREAIGAKGGENRLVIHGWRYSAARLLAKAGCFDREIQSVTGHKTLAMVQKYRAQANQKDASKRAQLRREQDKSRT